MHRLIVVILAAVDAAIAAAVGVAATLAPLTLLWVFGFGDAADWGALWPASATIWQYGNLVPLAVTIPPDYLAVAGIDPDAASFALTLAPLAFAAFTAIFAGRSGMRASQADAWITGVVGGTAVFAALASLVALTSANDLARVQLWQAILFPTLVFAVPALVAAVVTEWCEAGTGIIARVRDRLEAAPRGWGAVPGLIMRGTGVAVVGLVGLGALLTAVALVLRGDQVIALYEAAHLDVLGACVVTLAQLAYLPTVVVWSLSFIAGPGFALGEGTSVSAAGTQVGVVPGIPILGIIPDSTTPWLLLLALAPVALGALAGWIARSRLSILGSPALSRVPAMDVASPGSGPDAGSPVGALDAGDDPFRTAAPAGLLAGTDTSRPPAPEREMDTSRGAPEPIGARLVILLGIAVLSAAGAALLAAVASGAIGPGSLSAMGPAPGPVALAVGLEVILGAGILLLSPRARRRAASPKAVDSTAEARDEGRNAPAESSTPPGGDDSETAELPDMPLKPADTPPAPREPFVFPTLPRLPGGASGAGGAASGTATAPRSTGGDGGEPPVD
jgi:hypothetical protein